MICSTIGWNPETLQRLPIWDVWVVLPSCGLFTLSHLSNCKSSEGRVITVKTQAEWKWAKLENGQNVDWVKTIKTLKPNHSSQTPGLPGASTWEHPLWHNLRDLWKVYIIKVTPAKYFKQLFFQEKLDPAGDGAGQFPNLLSPAEDGWQASQSAQVSKHFHLWNYYY